MSIPSPEIEDLFFAASERLDLAERAAYLDETCGRDTELRRRVEDLLAAEPKVGQFLESPPVTPTIGLGPDASEQSIGTVIGPYKLLEPIGEGGMGVVYLAEQTKPVRRKVALKVIKPGMDTKQVIARFEAERQALALMDHPNIARVHDARATETGRPYFVMELVRGLPITEYCDREQLTIPERLELFILVCRAVQHAHQKGIIHRDLKPSNVLITVIDDAAVPKIIDFGIAKATGGALTDKTLFTGCAQLIGTPRYMSPEQADLGCLDIDTRSDIYSLGATLYELLTGSTPFDEQTLRQAGLDEVRRIIREQEPPRPSTRLNSLGASLTTVSDQRASDGRKLVNFMRGELDWIVMKCLEKDRSRRYETANGLASDLMRHLADEQVEACPPSAWYRFRKFVRRNRVTLTAAMFVSLAMVAGTVISTWQAVRATRAEQESGRQSGLALAAAETVRDREINLRHQAEDFAEQSRSRQVQVSIESGSRLMDEGDLSGSLPWFVEALRLDGADPARAEIHRIRLASTLAQCVKPAQIWTCEQPISSGEFRPDGRAFSIACWDGTICVRDVFTGLAVGPALKHPDRVMSASFSPDGQRIVAACVDRTARVWDIASAREVTPPLKHAGKVYWAIFSPDGSRIATSSLTPPHIDPSTCRVWDAATGLPVTRPFSAPNPAFSPDGRFIAAGDENQPVRLYHSETGEPTDSALEESVPVIGWSMHPHRYNPDGRILAAACTDRKVRLWDTRTGRLVMPPLSLPSFVNFASFSSDGRWLVTTSDDGAVQVWDSRTGAPRINPLRHGGEVVEAVFSPDGTRIATACVDHTIRVWDAASSHPIVPPIRYLGPTRGVRFSPDGRYLLGLSSDRTMRLWDLATANPDRLRLSHAGPVNSASFSPDGRLLVTTDRGKLLYWDPSTGNQLGPSVFHPETYNLTQARFSPDGRFLLTMSSDWMADHIDGWVWDVKSRSLIAGPLRNQLAQPIASFPVSIAVWSPDGHRLATATGPRRASSSAGCQVRVWDAQAGKNVMPVLNVDVPVHGLAFSPDSRFLAVASGSLDEPGRAGEVRIVNASTGLPHISPVQTPDACVHVEFSPDGTHLVTASGGMNWFSEGEARVWNAATGEPVSPPLRHARRVFSATFSPDGRYVLTASADGTTQIWDPQTGARLRSPMRHRFPVDSAIFSPDGRLGLTTSSPVSAVNGFFALAQVWEATTNQPVTPPLLHTQNILSTAFDPKGLRIATASADGAQIWELRPDSHSIDDWLRLADILSGTRLDATGVLRSLKSSELLEEYNLLRTKHPDLFTASPGQVLEAHYQQALECETARAWTTALRHLDPLIAAGRGTDALRRRRASAHAELGHWRQAVEEYQSLDLSLDDCLDDWYSVALAQLGNGDLMSYRGACSRILSRFGKAKGPAEAAELTVSICSVAPGAVHDYLPVIALAERLQATQPRRHSIVRALGALLVRAGRPEAAIPHLTEAARLPMDHRLPPIETWFFLALAHHHLGHSEEAKGWYEKAFAASQRVLADQANSVGEPLDWERRLTLRQLGKEAAELHLGGPGGKLQ